MVSSICNALTKRCKTYGAYKNTKALYSIGKKLLECVFRNSHCHLSELSFKALYLSLPKSTTCILKVKIQITIQFLQYVILVHLPPRLHLPRLFDFDVKKREKEMKYKDNQPNPRVNVKCELWHLKIKIAFEHEYSLNKCLNFYE